MLVKFPECDWCKRSNVEIYKCRYCKKFTCNDCLLGYNKSGRCSHRIYEPVESTGW